MLKKVWGAGVRGTEGFLVCCEADVENGFPQFTFIGSLTGAVRESGDRVRTAISNTGIYLDPKHVIINLSPADIRKEGNGYDLPVAAALLASYGVIPGTLLEDSLFAGELSLGGEILPVNGVLSMVAAAKEAGLKRCFLPMENLREGAVIRGISTPPPGRRFWSITGMPRALSASWQSYIAARAAAPSGHRGRLRATPLSCSVVT